MQTFSTRQAKIHFQRLIECVQAGEEFLITTRGEPTALLRAFRASDAYLPSNSFQTPQHLQGDTKK